MRRRNRSPGTTTRYAAPGPCTSGAPSTRLQPPSRLPGRAGTPSDHSCSSRSRPFSTALALPDGQHTVWAYAHVPNGSDQDITEEISGQIERFAPGFRATILDRHVTTPADFAQYNPNNVGGDIGAGAFGVRQVAARPRLSLNPYRLGDGVYLCSAATPPGAGVHGMNGYYAAKSALKELTRRPD